MNIKPINADRDKTIIFVIFLSFIFINAVYSQIIPFKSKRWEIEANESRIKEYKGRESLLFGWRQSSVKRYEV